MKRRGPRILRAPGALAPVLALAAALAPALTAAVQEPSEPGPPLEIRQEAPEPPAAQPPAPEPSASEPVASEPAASIPPSAEPAAGEPTVTEPEGTPAELFVNANAAYEAGNYARAVGLYRALLGQGFDNGRLHYNLGNAYLRNGELGRAVAAYRESLADRPRNQDVAANLAFARRSTRDALAPPRPSPVASTLFFWHYNLSRRELAWAALAVNLLFWGVLALRLLRRSEALGWLAAVLLLVLAATAGSLLAHHLWPQRVAVVLPQEIDAVSGPGADAVVRFKLHAGTEVEVQSEREGWVRIALPDGQQGWVEAELVEVVRW